MHVTYIAGSAYEKKPNGSRTLATDFVIVIAKNNCVSSTANEEKKNERKKNRKTNNASGLQKKWKSHTNLSTIFLSNIQLIPSAWIAHKQFIGLNSKVCVTKHYFAFETFGNGASTRWSVFRCGQRSFGWENHLRFFMFLAIQSESPGKFIDISVNKIQSAQSAVLPHTHTGTCRPPARMNECSQAHVYLLWQTPNRPTQHRETNTRLLFNQLLDYNFCQFRLFTPTEFYSQQITKKTTHTNQADKQTNFFNFSSNILFFFVAFFYSSSLCFAARVPSRLYFIPASQPTHTETMWLLWLHALSWKIHSSSLLDYFHRGAYNTPSDVIWRTLLCEESRWEEKCVCCSFHFSWHLAQPSLAQMAVSLLAECFSHRESLSRLSAFSSFYAQTQHSTPKNIPKAFYFSSFSLLLLFSFLIFLI